MSEIFTAVINELPPSHNNYLKYKAVVRGGKAYAEQYESAESKKFKRYCEQKLQKRIADLNWDISKTEDFYQKWYLDIYPTMDNMSQDTGNIIKILQDALSGLIYVDDKNILPRIQSTKYHKGHGEVKVRLSKVKFVGLFKDSVERDNLVQSKCSQCRYYREGACSVLKNTTQGRVNDDFDEKTRTCIKFTIKKS